MHHLHAPALLSAPVGPQAPNHRDDVRTVQCLLQRQAAAGGVVLPHGPLTRDGRFGPRTHAALAAFQLAALPHLPANGRADPASPTLTALCAVIPAEINLIHLELLYLNAPAEALAALGPALLATLRARDMTTPLRQAHFLAQVGHESGELRYREELADGRAYEGRADLGNTQPGDGPRFKGRGLIQLTGRANYAAYGRDLGRMEELLDQPQRVAEDPALCVDVAGWYWAIKKINMLADQDDFPGITRRINGGNNGAADRLRLLRRARKLLGAA